MTEQFFTIGFIFVLQYVCLGLMLLLMRSLTNLSKNLIELARIMQDDDDDPDTPEDLDEEKPQTIVMLADRRKAA